MKFHFVTVVWNDSYTDLFLKVVLPSQLSPGNLFSFRYDKSSVYKIYTTSKDAEHIRKSPVFSELTQIMSTEIVFIDDIYEIYLLDIDSMASPTLSNRFKAVSECNKRAINAAVDENAVFVLLSPDAIWSDGTFANLRKIAQTGKKGVMVVGLRVVKETFVPVFLERFYSENDFTASISSRELVKLALGHVHPYTQTFFWDSPKFHTGPSWLYWSVNNEGILARCFHLHPLMTCPCKQITSLSKEIDGSNYISFTHPNIDDLYIVEDSDEIVSIEISGQMRFGGLPYNRASTFKVAYWAKYNTNFQQRRFLTHKIRIHYDNISPRWKEIENYADKIVNSIYFLLKFEVIFHLVRLLEVFSPKRILSTGGKLLHCLISPSDLGICIVQAFLQVKMYPQAVFCLNKYLDCSGEKYSNYENAYNLASRLQKESCYEYAEQIFERLLKRKYRLGETYFHLGEISYWFKEDKAKAKEYLGKVIEHYPEHKKARKYIEFIEKQSVKR